MFIRLLFITVFLVAGLTSAANADIPCGNCGGIDHYVASLDRLAPLYDAAEANLKSKPQSEWTQDEIDMLLFYSLWIIYRNYQIEYVLNDRNVPVSVEGISESAHVNTWPNNPFNDWQPTQLLSYPAEFSAGNVVVETYNGMNTVSQMTDSFEVYIFGPSIDWPSDKLHVMSLNQSWANPPSGTIFALGLHVESEEERLARLEFIEA